MYVKSNVQTKSSRVIDRFSETRFLQYFSEVEAYNPINSLFINRLRKLPAKGTYEIKQKTGRPELISDALYGTTSLWWVIVWYNDIRSFYDLSKGMLIKYPTLKDLDRLVMTMALTEGMWL